MNNQKDTQKTDINPFGQSNVSDVKSLVSMPVYDFANKKTEKLVTALYLVSDCMETDDALKGKLRLLGVELLSDIYKLSTLPAVEKQTYLSAALMHIEELVSFIEISYTIGFISEMNTNILKKEFAILSSDLKSKQNKDQHFTFSLSEEMFQMPELPVVKNGGDFNTFSNQQNIKDNSNGQSKRYNTMSFINNKSPLSSFPVKKTNSHVSNMVERQDRGLKIISLIKDLPAQAGKKEVSIKDISLTFTDCSEKTIQRELNSLVSRGQLKKTGAKRWSRYSII